MPALHSTALIFFQDAAASAQDVHLIMIFTGIIAVCILLVILGVLVGALVVAAKISKVVKTAEAKAQPLIAKGQAIAGHVNDIVADLKPKIASVTADLQPKIASVTSDVQHISAMVRSKADEAGQTFTRVNETVQGYNQTAQDVNAKTKAQVQRVNGMVSDALTTTEHVSKQIQHGIRVPIEKVAGWVSAAKIGIEHLGETLGAKLPFLHHDVGPKGRAAGSSSTGSTGSTGSRGGYGSGGGFGAGGSGRPGPTTTVAPIVTPTGTGTSGTGSSTNPGGTSASGSGPTATGSPVRDTPPVG